MVQSTTSWRLGKLKLNHADALYDMNSAFHSTMHTRMDVNASSIAKPTNVSLFNERRHSFVMKIEPQDTDTIHLKIEQGGFMGDGNAPLEFTVDFNKPVAVWQFETYSEAGCFVHLVPG